MDSTSARTRPTRSASTPKRMPPAAEATRVAEARAPAWAAPRWNSFRTAPSANAKSITSKASRAQPRCAASSVRHCVPVIALAQEGIDLLFLAQQQGTGVLEGDRLQAQDVAGANLSLSLIHISEPTRLL